MKIINKMDYDCNFKINNKDIKCYSKKKMMELYPDGNYNIIGEVVDKNKKSEIGRIIIANKELIVSKYGKNNRMKYRRKYFVAIDERNYICLLKSNTFLICFLILLLCTIATTIFAIFKYYNSRVLIPDYQLPDVDEKSIKIEEDNTKKVQSKSGGGSARVRLSNIAKVKLSTGVVKIAFQNPNQSTLDCVISLVLINEGNEYYIAKSGLIKAGSQISELKLSTNGINLKKGVYKGKYIVDHYNPETGEKALTNSSFDGIEIQVDR